MCSSVLFTALVAAFASIAAAGVLPQAPPNLPNLYLVTTSQREPSADSSTLPDVSATSLFDPFDQEKFLLRLIGHDYNSLPRFNLTGGVLRTLSEGIEGSGEYIYNSTIVETGAELQFQPSKADKGNLAWKDGYLLQVDGEEEGWGICDGEQGERVISWKPLDPTCEATFIQAVIKPPY